MKNAFTTLSYMRSGMRDDRGSTAVEFALVASSVVLLMLVMIEAGRMIYANSSLDYAIDRAARVMLINDDALMADVELALEEAFSLVDPDALGISTQSVSSNGEDFTSLTATYRFDLIVPIAELESVQLSATRYIPE